MTIPNQQQPPAPPLDADTVRTWSENTLAFLRGLQNIQPGDVDAELLAWIDAIATNGPIRRNITQQLQAQQRRATT